MKTELYFIVLWLKWIEPEVHIKLKQMSRIWKETVKKRIQIIIDLSKCLSPGKVEITIFSLSISYSKK